MVWTEVWFGGCGEGRGEEGGEGRRGDSSTKTWGFQSLRNQICSIHFELFKKKKTHEHMRIS